MQNQHIIRSISLELDFENLEDAIGLQDRVADVFYEKLQPAMDKLFDEMAGEKSLVKLDKLEIDCGNLSDKNWEQSWVENTLRNLRAEINAAPDKTEIDFSEIVNENFLFYLEHGYFAWNNRIGSLNQLEQLMVLNKVLLYALKTLIQRSSYAAERLAYQFSDKFTGKIIRAFAANNNDSFKTIQVHRKHLKIDHRIVDAAILKAFANDNSANVVHQFFTNIYSKADEYLKPAIEELLGKYPEIKTEILKPEIKNEIPSEGIYISNAGLILLHPFFTELFEQFGLTAENHWIDLQSQHEAAAIMQFLVTGNEELPEFELPLNKILCGLDIKDMMILPSIGFSDEKKAECEDLLRQVIKHWSVLKNTGIDAFRETFLQRNGKLSRVDRGWLLQVEQNSVDVLMSHLPWGIGLVKTPWMPEMLYVEWT